MSGRKCLAIWVSGSAGLIAGHFAIEAWGLRAANWAFLAVAMLALAVIWLGRSR